jgi:S1-C subfamily serine protease
MKTLPPAPNAATRRAVLQRLAALPLAAALFPVATLAQPPAAQPRPIAPRPPLNAEESNHIAVFKAVSPSVVHITTLEVGRDVFSADLTQQPRGTGSGFVWDEHGHIVTNFHVIQAGNAARVTLADQTSYAADLVGAFPDGDLAVLRIDAQPSRLPPIPLGRSRDLQVGQQVYAIGNPFGLDRTMTRGIVSALDREIESVTRRRIRGAIQTDAAINPGNSGGPLLDSAGRLIGVNTAIFSTSGASAGIGFAIPVDELNRIVPRLIRDGRLLRPALGITAAPEGLAQALQLPGGVPIARVVPGGPAYKAGLKAFARGGDGRLVQGDVITAVGGEPVGDFDDMLAQLERHQAGERITLTLWRAGRTRQQAVELAPSD